MKKKLLIITLSFIFCFTLIGCNKEKKVPETSENNIAVGKFKMEKGKEYIHVITNLGNAIETTKYIYEGADLTKVELVQEYTTKSFAEATYEELKNSEEIIKDYKNINIDNNKIVLTTKDEIIIPLKKLSLDQLYESLYSTYKEYME